MDVKKIPVAGYPDEDFLPARESGGKRRGRHHGPHGGPTERALEPDFPGRIRAARGGLQPTGPAWHATCIEKVWQRLWWVGAEKKLAIRAGKRKIGDALAETADSSALAEA